VRSWWRTPRSRSLLVAALVAGSLAVPAAAVAAPAARGAAIGPVGWDTYRHPERMAELTPGAHTKQFSSFDRAGGNDDGYPYSCLRTDATGCVLAEQTGAGEIDSIWFTRDGGDVTHEGKIIIELDGRTVLNAPLQDVVDGKLGAPFVFPLVANADQSSGGVSIKVPMPYRTSMRVTVTPTDGHADYYHVTYRQFDSAAGVRTFDPSDRATDVIAMLAKAGTADPKPALPGARTDTHGFTLAPGATTTLDSRTGPGTLTALKLQLPQLVSPQPKQVTDDGRAFGAGGSSRFTVAVDPANTGVTLTRRYDPGIANQVADVAVDGTTVARWAPKPADGSGSWAEESVTLPASATAGRSSLTITNTFVSSDLDFNEFTYWADSTVNGQPKRTDTVDVGPSHVDNEAAHGYTITGQTWQGTRDYGYPVDGTASAGSTALLQGARLRVTVDGQRTVDAPLGEFFGSGLGLYDVRSLMFGADTSTRTLSAWWPMPFARGATVQLYNGSSVAVSASTAAVTAAPDPSAARGLATGALGYFRATANRQQTVAGQDYPFLTTTGRGRVVGVTDTMIGAITSGNLRDYLEGDERIYADGTASPDVHGTGTEDFFESGWYFNRGTYTNPFTGNPVHQTAADGCAYDCTGAYRLMLAEGPSFDSSLRFGIEHGPVDNEPATYSSTTYWYGQPGGSLAWTDAVTVGDTGRGWTGSTTASALTSTFEGDDGPAEPVTATVRAATGTTGFRLAVDPRNRGVELRRTSDQARPGQAATVSVDGHPAGTWTEPLGNTTHRWLDDGFALPASLTAGRSRITVTLTPVAGTPPWTAVRYDALSLVPPFTDRRAPGRVGGLVATGGADNSVTLGWQPARDDVYQPGYQVAASTTDGFTPSAATIVGTSRVDGFTQTGLGLHQTWYYRVRAVDAAGHAGPWSGQASATTGDTVRIEAESLLPPVSATAPAQAQGDCCGVQWSGHAQLWFTATAPGATVTVAFTLPTTGSYAVTAVQTLARDYGIDTLALDGTQVGTAFDAYHADTVQVSDPIDYGSHQLAAGRHTLTLTVTGHNAASVNYFAGLDYLAFHLQP
jgi:hypothetical protein